MIPPVRTALLLSAGLSSLLGLVALAPTPAAPPPAGTDAEWTSMNYWVMELDGGDESAARTHATEIVNHIREEHPGLQLQVYEPWSGDFELHFIQEAVNLRAEFFEIEGLDDDTCRELIGAEDDLFTPSLDVELHLISSDPEKEQRLGAESGRIIRTLESRFAMAGKAVAVARELTEYLNQAYPEMSFRAYDEWYPRSGRIHFHTIGTGVARWVDMERRMREDPEVRRIMEQGADAFVDGSFQDTWLDILAR